MNRWGTPGENTGPLSHVLLVKERLPRLVKAEMDWLMIVVRYPTCRYGDGADSQYDRTSKARKDRGRDPSFAFFSATPHGARVYVLT